jgi:hypothetical protein
MPYTARPLGTAFANIQQQNYIAHETTICRNPPIHSFPGDKNLNLSSTHQHLSYVMFLQKCKDKQFVCGNNILTEGVLVTQLSTSVRISV